MNGQLGNRQPNVGTENLEDIDKDFLYGRYEAGEQRERDRQDKRDKLYMKAAYKSLDIAEDPEDEMGVQANRTTTVNNQGMGFKELAVIAALLAGTGLGGFGIASMMANKNQPDPTPIVEKEAPVMPDFKDSDTLFDLEFAEPKDPTK